MHKVTTHLVSHESGEYHLMINKGFSCKHEEKTYIMKNLTKYVTYSDYRIVIATMNENYNPISLDG